MSLLTTIVSFIVAIGVLVTVHEFGHFWVARRLGVKVLRFSVGFGRPLWRRVAADGTEYVLAAIPLGGYVKMLDEREGEVDPAEVAGAFNRQSLAVRYAVVAAGPVFNFIFAIAAYWLVFLLGVSGLKALVGEVEDGSIAARAGLEPEQQIVSVEGRETATWIGVIQRTLGVVLERGDLAMVVRDPSGREHPVTLNTAGVVVDDLTEGRFFEALGVQPLRPRLPARIERVVADGAAARAGLAAGDSVLSANGEPVLDWGDWVRRVQASAGQPLAVRVRRGEATVRLEVTPAVRERDGVTYGFIGAVPSPGGDALAAFYVTERYGPVEALGKAVQKTWEVSALTVRMFWKMLRLEVSVQNLSGPISIAQYAGDSARSGPSRFLEFLAIVSISLGILNLLPIPVLDGGHLLFFTLEAIKGKPLSERAQIVGQHIGLMVLVGLMSLAFYNDLARLLS